MSLAETLIRVLTERFADRARRRSARRIRKPVDDVAAFLDALFDDRVVFYGDANRSGGWREYPRGEAVEPVGEAVVRLVRASPAVRALAYNPPVRDRLIRQLQNAYSGELAAAYAYRGHWQSVSDPEERERIRIIENEEWHHRDLVGAMLRDLGVMPLPRRELVFLMIGKVIGAACHVIGHFAGMYGAGKLERTNIVEYEDAADYALACGREDLIDCLLTMAEVEWEHERYFRSRVEGHPLLRIFRLWAPAPPKESIRARFADVLAKSA